MTHTDDPNRCAGQPPPQHGYVRINYHGSATPIPGVKIAFTDLTGTATLEVSQTSNGCTRRITKPFPTGLTIEVGTLELTVNSVNRTGSQPPTVSVEYRVR